MSEEWNKRAEELYTEYNVAGLVGHCLEEEIENEKLKKIIKRIENYVDRQHDIPLEIEVNIKNIIHSNGSDEE